MKLFLIKIRSARGGGQAFLPACDHHTPLEVTEAVDGAAWAFSVPFDLPHSLLCGCGADEVCDEFAEEVAQSRCVVCG